MGEFSHKEAHRLFWMVKGHLDSSEQTVFQSAPGYFKRLWGNHEACYREEGFEEAYQKMFHNRLDNS
jgi:hypothetical protein